jgi:hypothetical protein
VESDGQSAGHDYGYGYPPASDLCFLAFFSFFRILEECVHLFSEAELLTTS